LFAEFIFDWPVALRISLAPASCGGESHLQTTYGLFFFRFGSVGCFSGISPPNKRRNKCVKLACFGRGNPGVLMIGFVFLYGQFGPFRWVREGYNPLVAQQV